MKNTITITGENALRIQYIIALARIKISEFYALTDAEILETLIDAGEVTA